ncbi:putative isp4-oligopeptide transporter [Tilletiaria anomala UBC 951]|uniref:Putative isp4-oligopeptide transporter n=1 Tax=Tilletiaria anomala (strain ATCC 24038 / CBS 436.72 / UBC 951) TaxID=1037660 RepID=A0A066VUD6_TILAU|nr:putative isp4-oligopeptide transporter [Tilletiaria anomala UBC 951]KDN42409.1 putative isp4-oligopeptide transporter [Tilletiaria anomala UBC 951]
MSEKSSSKEDSAASAAELGHVELNLKNAITDHKLNDPNMDPELIAQAEQALAVGDVKAELRLEDVLEDDSIYPEVRAAVSNVDDPDMPVSTFRAWFLGILASIILSGVNQFFIFRYPYVTITPLVALLLAFPLGKAMALLPNRGAIGRFLNPGPFNIKEHSLIVIMASVSYGSAYATDVVTTQRFFYDQQWSLGYQLLLFLSTQLIGFSFAGFCRRWLVWPASMIWPSTLPQTALMSTLHHVQQSESGRMSRERFFTYAFVGAFCYYFLPGYLFTALSAFSWPTWIAPSNHKSGLGLSFISLDWAQITSALLSPLTTPFYAEANVIGGFAVFFVFLGPILYYNNVKYASYLPFASTRTFDRFGQVYQQKLILNADKLLDIDLYNNYSKQYLPIGFAISYGLSFASVTCILVHVALFYGKDIVKQFKSTLKDEPDIHARLMSRYKEVPSWWYGILFLISFGISVGTVQGYPTTLPVWALILALLIAAVYILPIGIVQAITNQQVGLNVITEFIVGYMLPGRPLAMMLFKVYGYIAMVQGLSFVSDLKFGHYMKIPPRLMFWSQIISTIIACFVQVGVSNFVYTNINDVCTPKQPQDFKCSVQLTFATASVIWGLIGPARSFSVGQEYASFLHFFWIGAVAPIPFWYLAKKFPRSFFRYVNTPVISVGTGQFPPATGINFTSWFLVGFIFQYWVRRRSFGWWASFNYVLSAALDSGTAISGIVIFFALSYPSTYALQDGNKVLQWWGNAGTPTITLDANSTSYLTVPDQGFAPAPNGQWGTLGAPSAS